MCLYHATFIAGANPAVRDNSGRRAEHYFNNAHSTKRVKLADLAAHKFMSAATGTVRSRKVDPAYPSYPMTGYCRTYGYGCGGGVGDDDPGSLGDSSLADDSLNHSWTYGVGSFLRGRTFRANTSSDSLSGNRRHQTVWNLFGVGPLQRTFSRSGPKGGDGNKTEVRRVFSTKTPPSYKKALVPDKNSTVVEDAANATFYLPRD